ncbi:MAG: 1-deoxy-D-xylulose-5-phosphate reductoisomerase [Clostridia bacterium]|nr:1-deoxy-D-xylulose-5-phosphate reductoisomerase [Clostridia bacterium]
MKLKIALLGSTGSIGRQVVTCVERYPERYEIVSLSACSNAALLNEQIKRIKPRVAALENAEKASLIGDIPDGTELVTGENSSLKAVLNDADLVFVAIVGFAGLKCVLKAIEMKKNVALANKETLVAGGEIVTRLAAENGVEMIPVDSEHSAIWQSMYLNKNTSFKRLIITASGGAFRNVPIEELKNLKAAEALKHPNWSMGPKITVDCATMVNKGLEVIEAHWLFNCPYDKIDVLYHPESIVHSLVEYDDGALIAQMGYPSMELPISLALSYPERLAGPPRIDLVGKTLHFDEIDNKRYPCFSLVKDSAKAGGNMPCALSSANEEAVGLYLKDLISFTEIYEYLSYALDKTPLKGADYQTLVETDAAARRLVKERFSNKH